MKDRIKWLEALRGIACLIVLFAHILSTHPIYGMYASGCGKIGVWIFMILSGYFLIFPYLDSDNNFKPKNIIPYYYKKLVKLYPIYVLTIFIAYRFGFIIGLRDIINHLIFRNAWGHLWYMPVIIKFYIISPLFLLLFTLCKKILNYNWIKVYIPLMLLAGIFFSFKYPYTTYIENSIELKWYLPVFIMGMIVALIQSLIKKHLHNRYIFDALAVFSAIMIIIQTPVCRKLLYNMEPSRFLQNQYLYMGLFWSLLLFSVSFGKIIINILENSKTLIKAGKFSFYIYLSHYIILIKLHQFYPDFSQRGIITITASIGFAIIFIYIQNVINILSDKFIKLISKAPVKTGIVFLIFMTIITFSSTTMNNNSQINNDSVSASVEATDITQLFVPTMINKINNDYFIVDCWNHRVIYSESLDSDLHSWETLTDEYYIGGHTICTDGELIVLDNTDNNSLLVYKYNNEDKSKKYELSQIIENVSGRPHFIVYDEIHKYFYAISSTQSTIHVLENDNGYLKLVRSEYVEAIANSYVRSFSIIDNYLYTVSGPGSISKYEIDDNSFKLIESYPVPPELSGMNQISKIDDYYYITVNTGATGSVDETTIVRTQDLSTLKDYMYEDLYDTFGFVGQPYYITYFDDKYYITEISEYKGNGIKSFCIENNNISNITSIFYYEEVPDILKQNYNDRLATKNTKEIVDLFIFAGQSNMSGKGNPAEAPIVLKGYEFRSISDPNSLYPITEPFGINENTLNGINDTWENMTVYRKSGSLISAFANSYYSYTGIPIVGVSSSEGATTISQWLPGTDKYTDLVNRTESAKNFLTQSENHTIRNTYLVWCQGESDGDIGTTFSEYYDSLNNLTSTLVNSNIVDHCFIIAIGENGNDAQLYKPIHDAQLQLCKDSDLCTLISDSFIGMNEQGLMIDEYHYSQKGYNIVGSEAGKNAAMKTFKNYE